MPWMIMSISLMSISSTGVQINYLFWGLFPEVYAGTSIVYLEPTFISCSPASSANIRGIQIENCHAQCLGDPKWFPSASCDIHTGQTEDSDMPSEESVSEKPSSRLGSKWAHPIPVPETGCVLIATDKLDGVRNYEGTVVLLLRIGTRDHREGPFGVILNRPLHKKIQQMKPSNPDVATTFADCPLHFGGPLDASIFLVRTNESSPPPSFEQVVPGVCIGPWNSLDEAASLVKKGVCRPKDFRFFVGYAGWQLDELREEIDSGFWIVAACSPGRYTWLRSVGFIFRFVGGALAAEGGLIFRSEQEGEGR